MKNAKKLIALNLALFLLFTLLPSSALAAIVDIEFPVPLAHTDTATFTVTSSGTYTFRLDSQRTTSCGELILYDSDNNSVADDFRTGTYHYSTTRDFTYTLVPGEYTIERKWGAASISYLTLVEPPKSPVTVNLTPPTDITYGETLAVPIATQEAIADGIDDAGTFSFSYAGTLRSGEAYSASAAPTEAGAYTVTATLVSETHSGTATASFSILPKPLRNDMLSVTGTYVYTGQAITPTFSLIDTSGTIAASNYQMAVADNRNAGSATLTVTATDAGNYSGTAVQAFSIAKKSTSAVDAITRDHPSDEDTPASIDLSVSLPADRGNTVFSIVGSSTGDTIASSEVDAITGLFTYELAVGATGKSATVTVSVEMQNYETVLIAVTISVQGKLVPGGTPVVGSGIHYGQPLSALSIAANMTVGDTHVSGVITWELPDSTPAVATTSAAWVFTPADTDLYAVVTGVAPVVVHRTTPSGTPTYTAIVSSGRPLSDAAIQATFTNPYNGSTVPGVLAWDGGANQTATANTSYGWTFTPAELDNYNMVTGAITPYVVTNNSYSGGSPMTNAALTPDSAEYGVYLSAAVSVTLNPGSYTLKALQYNGQTLVADTDYTVEKYRYTFTNKFLSSLAGGKQEIIFDMTGGKDPIFTITVVEGCPGGELCPSRHLEDVDTTLWYHQAIDFVVERRLMQGTGVAAFEPNLPLSRAMMVQVLFNYSEDSASAAPPFSDVSEDAWYVHAISWGFANEVVAGIGNNLFAPERSVTREEMALILYNYCAAKKMELPAAREDATFADGDKISPWAWDAVNAMYRAEVLNGKENNLFDPQGTATRAEVATLFMNFCRLLENI